MAGGKRSGKWRWRIFSGILLLVCRLSSRGSHGGPIGTRVFRTTEQFGMDVAPPVLFALVWLVADTAQPTDGQVRPR